MARSIASRVSYHDLGPDTGDFRRDVIAGLSRARKSLPPKYFYDDRGAELFEAICELPEYYVTRTELALMRDRLHDMARLVGPECVLIEYGSGSGRKTRILVEALSPAAYVPIDISAAQLERWSSGLAREYPGVVVVAVCADYSRPLALPGIDRFREQRRVVFFPGSTIGNFTGPEALAFLKNARAVVRPGGAMLIGVDLKKDPKVLQAAYDDAQGVTAAFNLNLLDRINRELGAHIDTSTFRHRAIYDEALGRIEMHLESQCDQALSLAGRTIAFRRGETIHTENSYKYTVEEFQELARNAGFAPHTWWTDPQELFSIHYLAAPQ